MSSSVRAAEREACGVYERRVVLLREKSGERKKGFFEREMSVDMSGVLGERE